MNLLPWRRADWDVIFLLLGMMIIVSVVLGIAVRSGSPISFWSPPARGAVFAPVASLLAASYPWLRISYVPADVSSRSKNVPLVG